MIRIAFFFLVISFVQHCYAQDSLDVIECFNHSDFESRDCGFKGNYKVRTAVISEKYIQMDSVETSNSVMIGEILLFNEIKMITNMTLGEVKYQYTENRHNYYKCYAVDSVPFYRIAMVSFPLQGVNADSIYKEVEKDLNLGKTWNNLKIHSSCPAPSQMMEIKGQRDWVQSGYYIIEFENAIIDLELGKTTLVKVPEFDMACIILKTDNVQRAEVRKVKLISIED